MRLLLDTHCLLWYGVANSQLSATATSLIMDAANEPLISPASYWEIAIKISVGKLLLHQPYDELIDVCLNRYGFRILPIEPHHTARVAILAFSAGHRDPFDRLLAAQALAEDVPIVSADVAFDHYGVRRLW